MCKSMGSDKIKLTSQDLVMVPLSDEERISGQLTEEHMGYAVSALHRDGIVVLENAFDKKHADSLNTVLLPDADAMAKMETTHYNSNAGQGKSIGNMSQGPPLKPELMYDDIWANGPAISVMSCVIGPKPRVNYANGNTALGNHHDARQAVHADLTYNHAQFPFGIVTNYYLTDVSPANGVTELWVGSHKGTSFADHRNCFSGVAPGDELVELDFGIREELLEARRAISPPIRPTIKKGSVIIRDLRLWHAGIANEAPEHRIMLAFVHTPWWYQCQGTVLLPESAKQKVQEWSSRAQNPVQYHAHFEPNDLDHLKLKFAPDFSSRNKGYRSLLPDLPAGYEFCQDGVVRAMDNKIMA